jgi:hypothetical protein
MYETVFVSIVLERLFLGMGLLFAVLAIIMSSQPAKAGVGEGANVT